MSGLLNVTELCRALQISRWTFYQREARGEFRRFQVAQPVGQKRFSAALVERYINGEPIAAIGSGSRAARRTA